LGKFLAQAWQISDSGLVNFKAKLKLKWLPLDNRAIFSKTKARGNIVGTNGFIGEFI
jgi:hypothetical protein